MKKTWLLRVHRDFAGYYTTQFCRDCNETIIRILIKQPGVFMESSARCFFFGAQISQVKRVIGQGEVSPEVRSPVDGKRPLVDVCQQFGLLGTFLEISG